MAVTPSDMYMNFLDATVTLDSANSSTLESTEIATGLSIRGGLAFLIHLVEIVWPDVQADDHLLAGLSTKSGETSVPSLGDTGCISSFAMNYERVTQGINRCPQTQQLSYLPPIPLASPKIVAYAATNADDAQARSKVVHIRIGFTTVKIDNRLYTELAETWGFSN